jgi:hypothetical protein
MTALAEHTEPSTEVATYTPAVLDEYRPRIIMAPDEARALDESLRSMMKAVLREGVDYGVIPGTGSKPSLLKPGAEKLLQWFGFGHEMVKTETERDAEGNRVGVTYCCTVIKEMPDGRKVTVATCEGYAGYDEAQFYITAEAATAKERANAEKYRRAVKPEKCVEYRAPWNSVIKMCQKRSLVGAALQATSASTLFTQDVEDLAPAGSTGPDVTATARQVIMNLPTPVRTELDRWYKAERWPQPGQWDAEQWCAALVQAGRLSAEANGPAPVQAEVVPDLDPADPWALRIEEIASVEDAVAVSSEVGKAISDGSLDDEKGAAVFAAISAREAAISQQVAA